MTQVVGKPAPIATRSVCQQSRSQRATVMQNSPFFR